MFSSQLIACRLGPCFALVALILAPGCKQSSPPAAAPSGASSPSLPPAAPPAAPGVPAPATTAPAESAPAAAGTEAAAAEAGAAGVAKIKVTNQGVITLNGKTITLEKLKATLTDAATKPTSILYQRTNPEQDPSAEAAPIVHEVLTLIMDAKVLVKLATDL